MNQERRVMANEDGDDTAVGFGLLCEGAKGPHAAPRAP